MKRWYVVHTQPQAELRALWHLENQGFECFLPRVRSLRRHARKIEHVLMPLFPRYLFARLDLDGARWTAINGTRGVVRLVANGTRPTAVSEGIVEDLQMRCDAHGIISLSSFGVFARGQMVTVRGGIFAGMSGQIADTLEIGRDRIQVLLNLLGVQVRVPLPAYAVEAA